LTVSDTGLVYEDRHVRVQLSPEFEPLAMEVRQPFSGTRSLRAAAEMALILDGLTASVTFLLEARPKGNQDGRDPST
jgi:hypothetical protein